MAEDNEWGVWRDKLANIVQDYWKEYSREEAIDHANAFREYFDDGFTPEDAWHEELTSY